MKNKKFKRLLWLGLALFAVNLAACSEQEQPNDAGSSETTKKPAVQTNLTDEEILQKAAEASKEIKSAEITSQVTMEMTLNEQVNKINTSSVVDYTLDPYVIKVETTSSDYDEKIVTYMDDSAMYFQQPGTDKWQKQSLDTNQDAAEMVETYSSAGVLAALKNYQNKVKITEEGKTYVISFAGSGDELKEIVATVLAASGSAMEAEMASLMDQIKINSLSYETVVDRETFYPRSFTTALDYQLEADGYKIKGVQNQTGTFAKINQLDKIALPKVKE